MSYQEIENDYEQEVDELERFMASLEEEDAEVQRIRQNWPASLEELVDTLDYDPE